MDSDAASGCESEIGITRPFVNAMRGVWGIANGDLSGVKDV